MIGEVFGNGESRHGEDLFLAHQPHGLVAQLIGVIDGDHAGPRGIERARLAGGMHRNPLADARRLLNRGAKLGFGVLVRRRELAVDGRSRGRFRRS